MPGGRRRYSYVEISPSRVPVQEDRRPEIYQLFRSPRQKTVIIQESRKPRRVRFARSPSPDITEARPVRRRSHHNHQPRVITISPSGDHRSRRARTPSPESQSTQYPTQAELAAMSPRPPPAEEVFVPLPDPLPKRKSQGRLPSDVIDIESLLGPEYDRLPGKSRKQNPYDERYTHYDHVSTLKAGGKRPKGISQIPRTIKESNATRELEKELGKLEIDRREDKKYYEDQIRQLQQTVDELRRSEREAMRRLDSKNAQLKRIAVENAEAQLREREGQVRDLMARQWAEINVTPSAPAYGQAPIVQQAARPVSREILEELINQAREDVKQTQEQYNNDRNRRRTSRERRGSLVVYPESRHRPRYS